MRHLWPRRDSFNKVLLTKIASSPWRGMCINAVAPSWARVRHWSAPEKGGRAAQVRKDASSATKSERKGEEVVPLEMTDRKGPWEVPLSLEEEFEALASLHGGEEKRKEGPHVAEEEDDPSRLQLPEDGSRFFSPPDQNLLAARLLSGNPLVLQQKLYKLRLLALQQRRRCRDVVNPLSGPRPSTSEPTSPAGAESRGEPIFSFSEEGGGQVHHVPDENNGGVGDGDRRVMASPSPESSSSSRAQVPEELSQGLNCSSESSSTPAAEARPSLAPSPRPSLLPSSPSLAVEAEVDPGGRGDHEGLLRPFRTFGESSTSGSSSYYYRDHLSFPADGEGEGDREVSAVVGTDGRERGGERRRRRRRRGSGGIDSWRWRWRPRLRTPSGKWWSWSREGRGTILLSDLPGLFSAILLLCAAFAVPIQAKSKFSSNVAIFFKVSWSVRSHTTCFVDSSLLDYYSVFLPPHLRLLLQSVSL